MHLLAVEVVDGGEVLEGLGKVEAIMQQRHQPRRLETLRPAVWCSLEPISRFE